MRSGRPAGRRPVPPAPWLAAALLAGCGVMGPMERAPVDYGGSLQTLVLRRGGSGEEGELTTQTGARVVGDTFVWQPWFIRTRADLDVAFDRSSGEDAGQNLRTSANGTIAILPQSPYPVTISGGRTDSTASGDFTGDDFVRNRASLNARAALPLDVNGGLRANWDRTVRDNSGRRAAQGADIDLSRSFGADGPMGIRNLGFSAGYRSSDFEADDPLDDDSDQEVGSFSLRTSGEPLPDVLVSTLTRGAFTEFGAGDERERRLSLQGLSTARWRPESLPFTATGVLRTLYEDAERDDAGVLSESRSSIVSGALSGRWPVDRNLSLNAGLRAFFEDITTDDDVDLDETPEEDLRDGARFGARALLGVNYDADPRDVLGFEWVWDASAQTENGVDSDEPFVSVETLSVGQGLRRDIRGALATPVRLSLAQDLGLGYDSADDEDPFRLDLSHSASASFNAAEGASSSFGRLQVQDDRTLVGDGDERQSVTVSLGLRETLDRETRLQGNLNARAARSVDDGDEEFSAALAAELALERRELFAVRNLDFRSILRLNIVDVEGLFGRSDELETDDALRNDLRNILTYRIGRLAAELEASGFQEGDGLDYLLLLRLRRDFGGRF